MFSSKAKLKQRTPENGINREDFIGLLAEEYDTTSSAEAKEQVTANLANFAYDPLNYEYLSKHKVIVIFLDLLVSGNEKLIEHGITGICNFVHDPEIRLQLIDEKHLELIRNLLEYQNPRILAPALTTLIYLQSEGDRLIIPKETVERVEELLKEVETEEKPRRILILLLLFIMRYFMIIRQCHFKLGATFQAQKIVTQEMVDKFVTLVGDENPIHSQPPVNSSTDHRVPGALLNGLVSGLIGSHFPGSGSLVVGQEYSFPNKCVIDREINFNLQLVQNRKIMKIAYQCQQDGQVVCEGVAKIVQRQNGMKTEVK